MEKSECEKDQFYDDMLGKWDLQNPSEVVLGLGVYRHVGIQIDGFEDVHYEYGILLREENYSSFVRKRRCAWQTHGLKRRNREK